MPRASHSGASLLAANLASPSPISPPPPPSSSLDLLLDFKPKMSGRQQRVMVQPIVCAQTRVYALQSTDTLLLLQNVIFKNLQQVCSALSPSSA